MTAATRYGDVVKLQVSSDAGCTASERYTEAWRHSMPVHLICFACGTAFTRSPSKAVGREYCSRSCWLVSSRAAPSCVCSVCGKAVKRCASKIRAAVYCSLACTRIGQWAPTPVQLSADGLTALIPLRALDGSIRDYTLVDSADAEWVNQWRWCLGRDGYARRNVLIDGKRVAIRLHRRLLGLVSDDGLDGDHINRNKLDNRRANLRALPEGGNQQNHPGLGGTSAYRGVSWDAGSGKWRASVKVSRKTTNVGYFTDELEAAEAARAARLRLMPYAVD